MRLTVGQLVLGAGVLAGSTGQAGAQQAQSAYSTPALGPHQVAGSVVGVVPMCVTTSGASVGANVAVICGTFGTAAPAAGGTSSVVAQGTAGTSPWETTLFVGGTAVGVGAPLPVTDPTVDALVAGGALKVVQQGPTALGFGTASIGGVSVNLGGAAVASANPFPVVVGNLPAVQPVSGTVSVTAGGGALAVSAAALPLPAGAASAANQAAQLAQEQAIAATVRANDAGANRAQTHDDQLGAANTLLGQIQANTLGSTATAANQATQIAAEQASATRLSGTLAVSRPDSRALAQPLGATAVGNAITVALQNGEGVIGFTVAGLTASGAVLTSEGSSDGGTSWAAINNTSPGGGLLAQTVGTDGMLRLSGAGHTHVRLRVSTAGTGTITVSSNAESLSSLVQLVTPLPPRSSAWLDASFTATTTASSPAALAAVASRTGLHVWNTGAASTVCLNYTAAASSSGSGCAAGSVPIVAGSAYFEDQPGNVSPEAISLVCAGASCPLTIKVR